jgi:hypothetical protein
MQVQYTDVSRLQYVRVTLRKGFKVLTGVFIKLQIFWDITPCSPLKVKGLFGRKNYLHLQDRIMSEKEERAVSCLGYSSILKVKDTCCSKISVGLEQSTWHYMPEDRTIQLS